MVLGRRHNVVTLREDIMVNGMCGTWVTTSFEPILYLAPIHRLLNPIVASYPQFIFSTTQKITDVVLPLIDAEVLNSNFAIIIMMVVSLILIAGNFTAAMGFAWFFYG